MKGNDVVHIFKYVNKCKSSMLTNITILDKATIVAIAYHFVFNILVKALKVMCVNLTENGNCSYHLLKWPMTKMNQ